MGKGAGGGAYNPQNPPSYTLEHAINHFKENVKVGAVKMIKYQKIKIVYLHWVYTAKMPDLFFLFLFLFMLFTLVFTFSDNIFRLFRFGYFYVLLLQTKSLYEGWDQLEDQFLVLYIAAIQAQLYGHRIKRMEHNITTFLRLILKPEWEMWLEYLCVTYKYKQGLNILLCWYPTGIKQWLNLLLLCNIDYMVVKILLKLCIIQVHLSFPNFTVRVCQVQCK